ncbi:MAG: hypothetical protein E6Q97_22910 [Desulfurellales bacterium]|nr:MAG: hypothetical protein E6Q97_22910 [Desulfurellales bacterium]
MTITTEQHDRLLERCDSLLSELEELGASSAIISISCCVSVGPGAPMWIASHFDAGDPLACAGLARDFLETGDDDDDGVTMWIGNPPDEPGDGWKHSKA